MKVPLSPLLRQRLLFVLLMIAILTGVRWNFSVVLICISFTAKDVEHLFMNLFVMCISSENFYSYFIPFINWIILLLFHFLNSLYILNINLLSVE
jgi:hypothetical protein